MNDQNPTCDRCGDPAVANDGNGWRCLAHLHDSEAKQIDLDGQAQPIPPDPTPPAELDPPAVQLGLDVDVPVAIKRRGRGIVGWQHPLS